MYDGLAGRMDKGLDLVLMWRMFMVLGHPNRRAIDFVCGDFPNNSLIFRFLVLT